MERNHRNNQLTSEYQNHPIFNQVEQYIDYYDSLSFDTFLWVGLGTKSPFNFNSYVFSSIKSTLISIKMMLEQGHINDAYSLVRNFRDAIVSNIYLMVEIDNNWNHETLIVDKVNNWVHDRVQLPDYRVMVSKIEEYEKLKKINALLQPTTGYYKNLGTRLNDHTHYNRFFYMMYNNNELVDTQNYRIKSLDQLSIDIRNIFIKHFVWLFSINEHYMMSSDHRDYLEMGETPPKNSEYWVATFVQDIFTSVIKAHRPDLAEELKHSIAMELD